MCPLISLDRLHPSKEGLFRLKYVKQQLELLRRLPSHNLGAVEFLFQKDSKDVDLQAQKEGRGMAVPVISCAPAVGILLRLLLGCDDARERVATLEALQHLIGILHELFHSERPLRSGTLYNT